MPIHVPSPIDQEKLEHFLRMEEAGGNKRSGILAALLDKVCLSNLIHDFVSERKHKYKFIIPGWW